QAPARVWAGPPLEALEATREHACSEIAQQQRDRQRDGCGEDEPVLHELHRPEAVLDRVAQDEEVLAAEDRNDSLRIVLAVVLDGPVRGATGVHCANDGLIPLQIAGRAASARV